MQCLSAHPASGLTAAGDRCHVFMRMKTAATDRSIHNSAPSNSVQRGRQAYEASIFESNLYSRVDV
jgi:hypothetical protein